MAKSFRSTLDLGRIEKPLAPEAFELLPEEATGSSDLERLLLGQLKAKGLPEPITEYRFDTRRQWRVDVAFPAIRLAVEAEGGCWTAGRHNRPIGSQLDMVKYNALAIQGWTLLRYPEKRIRDGSAATEIATVHSMLQRRGERAEAGT